MKGGFCLFTHTGQQMNQLRMSHFDTEEEAITAAEAAILKDPAQYVAVVPSLFYAMAERLKPKAKAAAK